MKVEITDIKKINRQKIVETLIQYILCMHRCSRATKCSAGCRELTKGIDCFHNLLGGNSGTAHDIKFRKEVAELLNGLHEDN